jgi:CRISPR-associated protein Cmr4
MFDATAMLFLTVETPLHAGTGRGLGAVDLPVQRERTTDYPMVQASGLKGALRAATDPARNGRAGGLTEAEHRVIFGPETEKASEHAGALAVGDARLLLFPVRSLAGVFAWTTSVDALARFRRAAQIAGLAPPWSVPPAPSPERAWVAGDALVAGAGVVLEEFSYTPDQAQTAAVEAIAKWLAEGALPDGDEYAYWREALPRKLCILPDDDFRDFARHGTEVQTHVRLTPETKTVAGGALWTAENLPMDTLLYAPLLASPSRATNGTRLAAAEVLGKVTGLGLRRLQLGGDETVGQGIVALRFAAAGADTGGGTAS